MVNIVRNPNMYWNCMKLLKEKTEFIMFDLETSGLSPEENEIIQISAIKYEWNGEQIKEKGQLDLYICPEKLISKKIEKLTGITNEFLCQYEKESAVFPQIYDFFGNLPVLGGYNICSFDILFLQKMYRRNNSFLHIYNTLDVLSMARDLIPYAKCKKYTLKDIVTFYGLEKDLTFHNALDDVKGTMRIFRIFLDEYKEIDPNSFFGEKVPTVNFSFFIWVGKRHDQRRIYFPTNYGVVYYDLAYRGWGAKDFDIRTVNIVQMVYPVYQKFGISNDDEMYYWAKKQIAEREK